MIIVSGRYTTAKIMIDDVEPSCLAQIQVMCNDSAFNNPIVVMPDTHSGKGSVIGFTMPFTDRLNPEVVGVDIGCGVLTMCLGRTPLKWIKSNIVDFDKNIKRTVPMGKTIHKNPKVVNQIEDWIMFNCGEKFLQDLMVLSNKIGADYKNVIGSIGTLGGGNHFIEIGVDEDENVWLTVHSGSRNFGLRTANYHINKMRQGGVSKQQKHEILRGAIANLKQQYSGQELNDKITEFSNKQNENNITNYLSGESLGEYLSDMSTCQLYAETNRTMMIDNICKQLERFVNMDVYEESSGNTIESVHNYIDFGDKIIRKGAIASYAGDKVVIPFNMRDGLIIGEGKSNADWNYSAPHGAGRLMSRTQATNTIPMDDYKESMKDVYSSCVCKSTVDESPMAYKDAELIKSLIFPTVEIITTIKPILNIKSTN
jgi:tRNA-splicing ligase RtcB (3'-phosphate/5'-hydroxy nucleic acid ligase)